MSLYETGTITGALNSTTISGTGTKWSDAKIGITNGSVLFVSSSAGMDGVYQIKRVINDTSIELAQPIYKAFTNAKYSILVAEASSTASFANQLAAALGYYQAQIDGWQQIMTGTGDIVLTAPDGTKVTIKSFTKMSQDIDKKQDKSKILTDISNSKDADDVREYLGLKEALIKGDFGVGSKTDKLPESLNGASGFFGAGSYAVGTSAAVVVQSSYGAERRGQISINMANEAFFRFCNSASESATTHPWKKIAAYGDTNVSFGSGFEVANKVGAGYIVFNIVNNSRPITDNGCKVSIEIPNTTERPYMLQRKNDGTTTGQIVNQLPLSSGQIAIQGTSGREFKKDIVDADATEALNRINELRFVNYVYKNDTQNRIRFGFIAEEAEETAPQYIKHMQELIDEVLDPDSGEVIDRIYRDRPCVDNNPIVMDLLGAIQVLTSKVNEQETRLLALEKQHPVDK